METAEQEAVIEACRAKLKAIPHGVISPVEEQDQVFLNLALALFIKCSLLTHLCSKLIVVGRILLFSITPWCITVGISGDTIFPSPVSILVTIVLQLTF